MLHEFHIQMITFKFVQQPHTNLIQCKSNKWKKRNKVIFKHGYLQLENMYICIQNPHKKNHITIQLSHNPNCQKKPFLFLKYNKEIAIAWHPNVCMIHIVK
jgi:hypothetical protein